MSLIELRELMQELGEPKFRAKQVLLWLNRSKRPNQMLNLPLQLRERLEEFPFGGAEIIELLRSEKDETIKLLFRLDDGNLVEGVLMSYSYGKTLCISTQAGCRMGCSFCASTLNGLVRNLTAGEMLSQICAVEELIQRDLQKNRTVTNVVLMGSGEPLDNYGNVLRFLHRATAEDGLGISHRNISLSTCGIAPKIEELILDAPHVTLCISLHAPNDALRNKIMPINNKYGLAELIPAAKAYADKTKRRVIFEYALIEGVNASNECARELANLLRGINCHVNLIPLNAVKERALKGVSRERASGFAEMLARLGISATVRRELGTDIEGACGQLRNKRANAMNQSGVIL